MRAWTIAIGAALVLHLAVLLFGGILFLDSAEDPVEVREVDLLTGIEPQEEEPELEEPATQAPVELKPDAPEMPLEMPELANPPAQLNTSELAGRLEAMSLSALEAALDGTGGAEGFGGSSTNLASGGRIGGVGEPGSTSAIDGAADGVFDIGALDQPPRVVNQAAPIYPSELRKRKVEGTVYVVFVVDQQGRVVDPVVETASDAAFKDPAIEAVRRWRFEPAQVRGEKVRTKLRVPIRFSLNG